jgi:predicted membrane protein
VVKIFIGLFLVFLGLKVLFGSNNLPHIHSGRHDTIFGEKVYNEPEKGKEYSVLFGKGVYDFTDVDLSEGDFNVKLSTVFGETVVKINSDMPVRIDTDAVFAGTDLPDGNKSVFGSAQYVSDSWSRDTSSLNIKADVVFGGLKIIRK